MENPLIKYILASRLEYGIDMGDTCNNLHLKTESELNNIVDRVNLYITDYKLHKLNVIRQHLQDKIIFYRETLDSELDILLYNPKR